MRWFRLYTFVVLLMLCAFVPVRAASVAIEDASALDVIQAIGAEKGKVVLVNFFASWCPPCVEEIPTLIKLRNELSTDKVVFLGVSMDENRNDLQDMVNNTPFNYRILHGNADVASTFNISGIPRLLIYDKQGKLAVDHTGFAPDDALGSTLKDLMEQ